MNTKAWSGRFKEEIDTFLEDFTESVSFDYVLAPYEIRASLAYAKALRKAQILTEEELKVIEQGLRDIEREIREGTFSFRKEQEDVHMNIERALFEKIGEVAYKLHTGRSRNEQVVTDLRLYLADEAEELKNLIKSFIKAIVEKGEAYIDVIMPGFTHLQHAQPVLFTHWLTTYAEAMTCHLDRIIEWEKRLKLCPLGSSAFAGTGFPIDRDFLAKELGFLAPIPHSIYAVSSRDFSLELLFILSLIMLDLSRFSEELILWLSPEFGFIDLPDRLCTGSSIMPQKKNPDSAELIRGKASIVLGNLMQHLILLKNLPLSYNRDLQEDKPPLFQALKITKASLRMATLLVEGLQPKKERLKEITKEGYLLATEVADYLVTKGIPFRQAHHLTGQIVRYAEENNRKLEDLTLEEYKRFSPLIEKDIYQWLTLEHALFRRNILGGTGKKAVRAYLKKLRKNLRLWEK
ncbi:MAG: argininosuccinate lyase [Caldimicrobium sp.]|nr:argininosuccinate lyase [Caldimicrobium sp.]MCX7873413.1 argininosuccinate lyase [Caldimicrobium sp.]MDW8094391.1 argininosuccinate lyase [Caldimicrobium sp.]